MKKNLILWAACLLMAFTACVQTNKTSAAE
jgi:hypothetical protein